MRQSRAKNLRSQLRDEAKKRGQVMTKRHFRKLKSMYNATPRTKRGNLSIQSI